MLLAAMSSCAGPFEEGPPCGGLAKELACGDGRTCAAGRCRAADALPAPSDALRLVLEPADVAVIAGTGSAGGASLPATVVLGSTESGTVTWLFHFAPAFRDDAEVLTAVLVLEALRGSPTSLTPTHFETARILEPWQPELVSQGRAPALTVPTPAGSWNLRPGAPIRIDVTPLVSGWSKHTTNDHGIALLAEGKDAAGAVVATGISLGHGPRLEVYLK